MYSSVNTIWVLLGAALAEQSWFSRFRRFDRRAHGGRCVRRRRCCLTPLYIMILFRQNEKSTAIRRYSSICKLSLGELRCATGSAPAGASRAIENSSPSAQIRKTAAIRLRKKVSRQSSGECVQGGKTPCTFNKQIF